MIIEELAKENARLSKALLEYEMNGSRPIIF